MIMNLLRMMQEALNVLTFHFACSLFNNVVNYLGYIMSNIYMIINGKGYARKWLQSNLRYVSQCSDGRIQENNENLSQDFICVGSH
jgi:hypothetical protein